MDKQTKLPEYRKYTDAQGNQFELIPGEPYQPGQHACHECAFKFGNSSSCRSAKSCTPYISGRHTGYEHVRLTPAGYVWQQITQHQTI